MSITKNIYYSEYYTKIIFILYIISFPMILLFGMIGYVVYYIKIICNKKDDKTDETIKDILYV
jgi:hypothetical protein